MSPFSRGKSVRGVEHETYAYLMAAFLSRKNLRKLFHVSVLGARYPIVNRSAIAERCRGSTGFRRAFANDDVEAWDSSWKSRVKKGFP